MERGLVNIESKALSMTSTTFDDKQTMKRRKNDLRQRIKEQRKLFVENIPKHEDQLYYSKTLNQHVLSLIEDIQADLRK